MTKTKNKTVRVKLRYTRKVTQIEKGFVTVEIPVGGTVGDAYEEANKKNWMAYLPTQYEVLDEDWVFKMKEGNDG